MSRIRTPTAVLLMVCGLVASASAQQVTIGVTEQSLSDDYWEFIGGSWSMMAPGYFFNVGGLAPPPFGGFDPNAGLTTGFGIGDGDRFSRFHFTAGQGRSTVYTSTTPMLTVTNGVPGSMFVGTLVPFVTGVVPVGVGFGGAPVGNAPFSPPQFATPVVNYSPANSLMGRMQRGEFHVRNGQVVPGPDPDLPGGAGPLLVDPLAAEPPADAAALREPPELNKTRVAAARSADSETQSAKVHDLVQKARQLEADGKPGAARLLYQTALHQAEGALRDEIKASLDALAVTPK
jgi:hypothetical protein